MVWIVEHIKSDMCKLLNVQASTAEKCLAITIMHLYACICILNGHADLPSKVPATLSLLSKTNSPCACFIYSRYYELAFEGLSSVWIQGLNGINTTG